MRKLYIVGNGFDLYHGLNTSYNDFKEWLKSNDGKKGKELFERICEFQKRKIIPTLYENWGNVEVALKLDQSRIQNEKDALCIFDDLIVAFQEEFHKWIYGINNGIESSFDASKRMTFLTDDDYYIVFNYTQTLEKIYGFKCYKGLDARILYIHNRVDSNKEDFCNAREPINSIVFGCAENIVCDAQKETIFTNYCRRFSKDAKKQYEYHRKEIEAFEEVGHIVVMGHSMNFASGDNYYFEKIAELFPDRCWKIYCYSEQDGKTAKESMERLGAKTEKKISYKLVRYPD